MWQLLYNDTYVVPQSAVYSSHTTSPGETEDSHTPLTPFFSNETHFWTSDMVRDHEVFNYTYAEVANKSRAELVGTINRLYGNFSPAAMFTRPSKSQRHGKKRETHLNSRELYSKNGLSWNSQTSARPAMSTVFSNGKYREWVANIRVKKHAMGNSFSIHLFLGEVPSDSLSWPVAPSLVGTLGVFAHRGMHGMHSDRMITGTVPMTSALMNLIVSGQVPSLHAHDVEPFLKSNLEIRVSLANGTTVDIHGVDGLYIQIVSSMVKAPESENVLSEWGKVESHFDLFA